ncbi:ABC transporter permease [Planomicrobium sp. YIM 101495]|uniref:ABC transporter permease n=1 Tax=Planomicrobium sp. YIM 101495 TaxID=2665160 RepID=UPI0012B933A0|nr:ABC transporter permease [Planomicrobium sp. YIM 101495]MTD31992.1 ABC transporter permease [Planomicrobium sp. YIM 101495]
MRNTMKVAKWEIMRNMKSKSFLIGMFLTPIIFLAFLLVPQLFAGSDDEGASSTVYVNDELGVFAEMEALVARAGVDWKVVQTDRPESEAQELLAENDDAAYVLITEEALQSGTVTVHTNDDTNTSLASEVQLLGVPLQERQIEAMGLTSEQAVALAQGIVFEEVTEEAAGVDDMASGEDAAFLERIVPGAFAAVVLLSIVFTGMAIFTSASQEKKDKIAEIILSSLTPGELMQGKILGYFVLGIIQLIVFVVLVLPVLVWRTDVPILEYLLVPELMLLLLIAVLGYWLYASIFVGIGATMADMSTAGNFQGFVMMLPFSPFIFVGPVFADPSGIWAQIGSYIPFTSPGVLILRLSLLEEWPWVEIIIATAILIVSGWICMKLAGKIFKTGILLYGKNATPGEILKWLRA